MKLTKSQYPSKTDVNLLYRKKAPYKKSQLMVAVVAFAILLLGFTKFAVVDRLTSAYHMLDQADYAEARLEMLKSKNSNYDEILKEYRHYYAATASEAPDTNKVSSKIIGLLEDELLKHAKISSFNYSGNTITARIGGIDLSKASAILTSLEKNPLVKTVSVSTANTQLDADTAQLYITIILEDNMAN